MLLFMQRCFLGAGSILIAMFAVAQVHSTAGRQQALDSFTEARSAAQATQPGATSLRANAGPDQALWAESRIEAYEASLVEPSGTPTAILRIEALDLVVPVFHGTSELNLNRGAGWIEGTAEPGEIGNVGIAGHRDGFFRALKDIGVGDTIEVETLAGSTHYTVAELLIVEPADVHVLAPGDEPSVTLVTCYPFYFVGHAPKRFIVRGVRADFATPSISDRE